MTSDATATFTSMTSASSGVPSVGNPKPIAPLTNAAAKTATIAPSASARAPLAVPRRGAWPGGRPGAGSAAGRRRLHGRRQSAVAERDRDVVVLALEAERAGHAAAARIHLGDLESGPAERRDGRPGAHERLLVTVAVEQRLPAVAAEPQREPPASLANEKLLEQERLPGDGAGVVAAQEVDALVAEGEEARRLEPDDRHTATRVGRQPRDVPGGVLARLGQHALGDERAPAAPAVDQHDAIAGRLEHLDGGDRDLRHVVGRERVVEQHHLAARRCCGGRVSREPVLEGARGQRRQRAAAVDPGDLLERPAARRQPRQPVEKPRQ